MSISNRKIEWLSERRLREFLLLVVILTIAGCGRSTTEKMGDALGRSDQAAILFNQQNYVRALSEIHEAIIINGELKRDSALGENYILLGLCQRKLGAYDSALTAFTTSLEYFHLVGDQKLERRGRIALAQLSYDLHRYRNALSVAADAAAEGKVFADSANTFQALLLVARSNHKLRNFPKEISVLEGLMGENMIGVSEEVRQDIWEMLFHARAGRGVQEDVRATFSRWCASAAAGGDSAALARPYVAWGQYQELLSHPDSASRVYSHALNLIGGKTKRALQSRVLTSLGNLSYKGKHLDNARLYYTDAQHLAQQENNILLEQSLNLMLVACDWKSSTARNAPELEKRCAQIASVCAQTACLSGEVFAFFLQGMIADRRGDTASALPLFRHALARLAENVVRVEDDRSIADELTGLFLEGENLDWFDPLLRVYCLSKNAAEVMALLERRTLRKYEQFFSRLILSTADRDINRALEQITLKRNATQLLEADILGELAGGRARNLERFETLKDLLPQRLADLRSSVESIDGNNFRWVLYPKLITMRMIQDTLPPNTGLAEYCTLENQTFVVLVTRDTFYVRNVNVARRYLLSSTQEYNRLIGDVRLNADVPLFDAASAERRIAELAPILHSWLFEPIAPMAMNLSKLYVVFPEEYGWLPLHTLRPSGSGAGSSLINKLNIGYLPSAAALFFSSTGEEYTKDIVGFGHAGRTSWDVEYELKDIRGFYDKARMFFDTTATLGHLIPLSYDLLHVAASFTLHVEMPDSSAVTLSDGVTPYGVEDVSLGKMLIVPQPQTLIFSNVSPVPGGLWRYPAMAFLAGGSRNVILTMWQGERKAKKYFGEVFYTNLMAGISTSTCYHQAIVAMLKNEETMKSFQWGLYYQFGR